MTETRTLAMYLNEEKPDQDLILKAARYVAIKWAKGPTQEELQDSLAAKTTDRSALQSELAKLEANPELMERAALLVLSMAWEAEENHTSVLDAFAEVQAELSMKEVVALAAVLVFGVWVFESHGGETYRHTHVVRDANGAFRQEETVVRQPFPLDPIAIIHEFLSPHDAPALSADGPLHLTSPQIRQAQTALVNAGYKVAVDGVEGPHTDVAVEKYQRDRHLTVTGKLDRATLKEMGVSV